MKKIRVPSHLLLSKNTHLDSLSISPRAFGWVLACTRMWVFVFVSGCVRENATGSEWCVLLTQRFLAKQKKFCSRRKLLSHKLAVSSVDRSFFACFLSSSHRWWSAIGLELNCEDQLPGWRSVDDGDDVAASGQDGTHLKRELCRHEPGRACNEDKLAAPRAEKLSLPFKRTT